MDVRFINPFIESVGSVFQTMLAVRPARTGVRVSDGNGMAAALTSLIGISGSMSGVVVLRFPSTTAMRLAARILGNDVGGINDDVIDAISEITNMVAGSAKAKFNVDPPLQLGLPTVVQGSDYKVKYPSKTVWLEVPFSSEAGEFSMQVTFEAH